MSSTTGGTTPSHHNDGRDNAVYQCELWNRRLEGRRLFFTFLGMTAFVSVIISFIFLNVLIGALGEWGQSINNLTTKILVAIAIWIAILLGVTSRWHLWVTVPENSAWILIDTLFGGPNPRIKLGTGFYLIPPWWLAKENNLLDCEKMTRELPDTTYSASGGKGAVKVKGSWVYRIEFDEAEEFIGLATSTVEGGLNDVIASEIGPVIKKLDRTALVGDTSAVSKEIADKFLPDVRCEVEKRYHVNILGVMIRSITPDEATQKGFEQEMKAEIERDTAPNILAQLKDGDKFITDADLRIDVLDLLGKTTSREKRQIEVRGGDGALATAFALLEEIKGVMGRDTDKGDGKKGKKGK